MKWYWARLHDPFFFQAAESVELDVVRKWVKNNFVTFEVWVKF